MFRSTTLSLEYDNDEKFLGWNWVKKNISYKFSFFIEGSSWLSSFNRFSKNFPFFQLFSFIMKLDEKCFSFSFQTKKPETFANSWHSFLPVSSMLHHDALKRCRGILIYWLIVKYYNFFSHLKKSWLSLEEIFSWIDLHQHLML